jgi:hypothetical protein
MPTNVLTPIPGQDSGGTVRTATGVGTSTGDPIDISPQRPNQRDNRGRSLAVKITKASLVGGKFTIMGRLNPNDANGWSVFYDIGINFYSLFAVADGSGTENIVLVFGADYRQLRVDTVVTSGTMDVDFTLSS